MDFYIKIHPPGCMGENNSMGEHTNQNINDTRIHLALSPWDLTDGYNQHAGVTIASFLDNCHGEKAAVHLLYDERLNEKNPDGAEENKKKYAKLCDKFGADLYYHHVELPEWVNENRAVKRLTPGTLMRFYLSEILQDVSTILYLDCDVVVNTDIRKLWRINLGNVPLGAVHDTAISSVAKNYPKHYFQELGSTSENYFNAGVLLINLNYLRMNKFTSEKFLKELYSNLWFPLADQDILNKLFGETYLQLDPKYNLMVGSSKIEFENGDTILHYVGDYAKPWKRYHGKIDLPYWTYLLETPWREEIVPSGKNLEDVLKSPFMLPTYMYLHEQDFATIYEHSGLPYVTLMKKIIPSLFTLTKKRVGDFIRNHF